MVESAICSATRYDWVANYGTVDDNFKYILDDLSSDMIAVKIINYDTDGFSSSRKAELMLDVLTDNINRNINILKNEKNKEVFQ